MSLPPDPHDDDVAEPPTPPPAAAERGDAPAPPPPPASGVGSTPLPPPSSPAYPQPFEAPPAPPTVPTAAASDVGGSVTVAPPPTGPGGADATTALDTGAAPDAPSGRRSRLGMALAGVVAVVVIAGGVVLATGGDDGDSAAPASDSSPVDADEDAEEDSGTGGSDNDASADAPADSEAGGLGDGDDAEAPVDAPTGDDSPVTAAEEFFAAVSSGDCEGMVARMTTESFGVDGQTPAQAVDECESDAAGTAAASRGRWEDVRLISMDGDEATVGVTLRVGGQQSERELPMALVDGEWKMDLDVTTGSGL